MKFENGIDLQKRGAIRNAPIDPLSSAPVSPALGQVYFDTALNRLLTWNGAAWTNSATDSIQLNGQNAAFYLSRANHTGTQTAATISDLTSTVQAYRLDQFVAPNSSVGFNSQRIINLADPVGAQDAATMGWVQSQVASAAAGIDNKASVRVVANTNIALSGTQTIDGVALSIGDRVLVRGQTTASQNGVYVVAAGAWSRATDADQNAELTPGAFWFVEEGTTYNKTQWRIENTGTITIGTTSITINQFGAANAYVAGNGLILGGNTFSVQASTGISVSGAGVAIDTTVVPRKFAFTAGNGALTSLAITHSLGTKDVAVSLRYAANDEAMMISWVATDNNTVTIGPFAVAPAANSVKGVIIG